jgi:large subunit ribosomal protein L21
MKYAIVESGGKQYKAVEGSPLEVDLLPVEAGTQLSLDNVLMVVDGENISIGTPYVEKASVKVTVAGEIKGPKLIVFKYRPKKRIRVKTGHRQKFTKLMVDSIFME